MRPTFNTFSALQAFVHQQIGIIPASFKGIEYHANKKIEILRSVDNTPYYDDDLDVNNPIYTFQGKVGNQSLQDKNNYNILDSEYVENMYLYRVTRINSSKKRYTWYGEVSLLGVFNKLWPDENGNLRLIYQMELDVL